MFYSSFSNCAGQKSIFKINGSQQCTGTIRAVFVWIGGMSRITLCRFRIPPASCERSVHPGLATSLSLVIKTREGKRNKGKKNRGEEER